MRRTLMLLAATMLVAAPAAPVVADLCAGGDPAPAGLDCCCPAAGPIEPDASCSPPAAEMGTGRCCLEPGEVPATQSTSTQVERTREESPAPGPDPFAGTAALDGHEADGVELSCARRPGAPPPLSLLHCAFLI